METADKISPQCRHRDHHGCRWFTYTLLTHEPPDFESLFWCECSCHKERAHCPDEGACHHDCLHACWRVEHAEPLSGVYPGDKWPQHVLWRQHSPTSRCYFHGEERVDETTFRICLECGHVWTREALETAALEFGAARQAEHVYACPECAHDF